MRALSLRQAANCETAKCKACRCRCGGKLHGMARIEEPDREFFEWLPADDPHHLPTAEEQKRRRKIRRRLQKQPAQMMLWEERV